MRGNPGLPGTPGHPGATGPLGPPGLVGIKGMCIWKKAVGKRVLPSNKDYNYFTLGDTGWG